MANLEQLSTKADPIFTESVMKGLSRRQKSLPSSLLYDARGSKLFEKITTLAEYYPTSCELEILTNQSKTMVGGMEEGSLLIEFGSGSSVKSELLLQEIADFATYVPIDVSVTALREAEERLKRRFPQLTIHPLVADFSENLHLPEELRERPKRGFFPGSTIGNFTPLRAIRLLSSLRTMLMPEKKLIIGVDQKKDLTTLLRAYNDAEGITAQFNLNLLHRINREIEPAFDPDLFYHEAIYHEGHGRIEMHLVSKREIRVMLLDRLFYFREGETIHTENSYKYSFEEFERIAHAAGWSIHQRWNDRRHFFAVYELC